MWSFEHSGGRGRRPATKRDSAARAAERAEDNTGQIHDKVRRLVANQKVTDETVAHIECLVEEIHASILRIEHAAVGLPDNAETWYSAPSGKKLHSMPTCSSLHQRDGGEGSSVAYEVSTPVVAFLGRTGALCRICGGREQ